MSLSINHGWRKSRVLALSLGIFAVSATHAHAEANLTISESFFDFGFIPQNCQLSHVFWLKSTGTDSLIIDKIVPGCGCTKAPLDKERIAVGDSARLEIIYSSHSTVGKVTKTPRITVKGSDLPRSVQFGANVVANPDSAFPVVISPYKLDVSQFGEKKRTEISFTITNRSDDDLAIAIVDYQREFFTVTLPTTLKKRGEVSGILKVVPDMVGESFEKSLTLALTPTAGQNREPIRYTVPVKRTVRTLSQTNETSVPGAAPATAGH